MRVGIVALGDLADSRRDHDDMEIRRTIVEAELERVDEPPRQAFSPPKVLVVMVSGFDDLSSRRAWFADCRHLVIGLEGDALTSGHFNDRVLATAPPGVPAEIHDVCNSWDYRLVIERALEIAATLGDDARDRETEVEQIELPCGPWIEAGHDIPRRLAQALTENLDGVWLRTPAGRFRLDDLPPRVELALESRDPLSADPCHPIRWRGVAMDYRGSFLTAPDENFPCDPAAAGNAPIQVAVSPTADLMVVGYQRDALVTSAVPIQWQAMRLGDAVIDVAAFDRDPHRAVLFARQRFRDDDVDLQDDGVREMAPPVMLAGEQRYAVGLEHRTYRGTHADHVTMHVEELRVPPPDRYAIYAHDHSLVRHARGRLMGGWYRHATIHDGLYIVREDLVTGERRRLAPWDLGVCEEPDVEAIARDAMREGKFERALEIHAANRNKPASFDPVVLAVPGTKNVLYVGDGVFRVI